MSTRSLIYLGVLAAPLLFFWLLARVRRDRARPGRVRPGVPFRWQNIWKSYLSLLFLFIGIYGHFLEPEGVVELIPPFFPFRLALSYLTGAIELAFVVLLWTRYERATGLVIIAYLILVLPFNIYGWTVPGNTPNYVDQPNYLWFRVPLQILFIAFAYFGTRRTTARTSTLEERLV